MRASTNNRRNPENSDPEKRRESPTGERRYRRKQSPKAAEIPVASPPPQLNLRRGKRNPSKGNSQEATSQTSPKSRKSVPSTPPSTQESKSKTGIRRSPAPAKPPKSPQTKPSASIKRPLLGELRLGEKIISEISKINLTPAISKLREIPELLLKKSAEISKTLNKRSVTESKPAKPPTKAKKEARKPQRQPIKAVTLPTPIPINKNAAKRDGRTLKIQPPPTPKPRQVRSRKKRPFKPVVYLVRLLILGIGIGAIAGTLLSIIDPGSKLSVQANGNIDRPAKESPSKSSTSKLLPQKQEIAGLKAKIQTLVAQNSKLQPGVFVVDLDTGAYLDFQSNISFPAASTIKIPILVAFFQDVDAGKIRLDEPLILEPDAIASGSGNLQYQKPGTKYTALEIATKMSTISDNTATNMIIKKLGGAQALNQRFHDWGLTTTVINNPLPDLEGTNTTNPKDLATLIFRVNEGELLSLRSRDRLLDIMHQTVNNSLIPQGLEPDATIAHKTGDIGSMIGDAGLVDMPSGKRYVIAIMVKRPHNDGSASELVRQISRAVYQSLNKPNATPTSNANHLPSTSQALE